MNAFDERVAGASVGPLRCRSIDTLQVNVGVRCNQACAHCHQMAGPERDELMDWPTMEMVVDAADTLGEVMVDITGGAPELNPHLRQFIALLRAHGHPVMVRTNLTCMREPGSEGFAEFYAENGVELLASLPCYEEGEVRLQRGPGVFEASIEVLRHLNSIGYGTGGPLVLNLVYNHVGPCLSPPQDRLEGDYKRILDAEFDLHFDHLFTITNMPIGRFLEHLEGTGQLDEYMSLLRDSFNPETLEPLMCRTQVCVRWDGTLFDCDFNMAKDLRVGCPVGHVREFDPRVLEGRSIVTGDHCLGCTAGSGSSCGGALL